MYYTLYSVLYTRTYTLLYNTVAAPIVCHALLHISCCCTLHVAKTRQKTHYLEQTASSGTAKKPKHNVFFQVYSAKPQVTAASSCRLRTELCQALHFLQRPAKALCACDNATCSTPCTVCCTMMQNAVNTSALGMVAKGMDACDNMSCSTSLRSMLYKAAKTL